MINPKFLLKFIVPLLLFSCGSATKTLETSSAETTESLPKILFLEYRFFKTTVGKTEVELLSKLQSEGKLKATDNTSETNYELRQLDANKQILEKLAIEDPLTETVEVVNDNNELSSKTIQHQEKNVFYRIQVNPNTRFVQIVTITPNNETEIAINPL